MKGMAATNADNRAAQAVPRRRRWHLHRIAIVGGLIVLVVGMVFEYFSDYHQALRAIAEAGGTTDADGSEEQAAAVRMVALGGPSITDAEIERVAPHLPHLPDLFTLNLSMANVTDRGLGHLRGLNHLGDIILRYTQVTDQGLEFLAGWDKLAPWT
jgi:hypothetical protein